VIPARKFEPPTVDDGGPRMSLLDHLGELRTAIFRSLIGMAVAFGACYWKAEAIFEWLMAPVLAALPEGKQALNFTSLVEPFFTYLKVAAYAALFVASPWVLWQVWSFVSPGLYAREKRFAGPFVVCGTLFFAAGGAFCYYLVLPSAFEFLVGYASSSLLPMLTMRDQLSLVLTLELGFGIVFEMPLLMAFLGLSGLVSPEFFARYRRYAIVANVAIAAIVTPTGDPFNLALMAVPMVVMYELGILAGRVLARGRKAKA
jgi:sec-independent protein translocase protein TatC